MLKNIQLFTLLGLMLSGNTAIYCAQANNHHTNDYYSSIDDLVMQGLVATINNDAQSNEGIASVAEVETTTPAKKHKCTTCDKSFSLKSNLVIHKRTHTGEKPFQCDQCNKSFSDPANLNHHIRTHTNVSFRTKKPSFHCNICDKFFSNAGNLKNHQQLHTDNKPYLCNFCDKSFSQKGYLTSHIRIHTKEKPYTCETCNKSFSQSDHLRGHKKIHLKIKTSSHKNKNQTIITPTEQTLSAQAEVNPELTTAIIAELQHWQLPSVPNLNVCDLGLLLDHSDHLSS